MKAKATPRPNLVGKEVSDRITRVELVRYVAGILPRDIGDDDVTMRNRISVKVRYDVHWSNKLKEVANGIFTLGAVSNWARQEWPGFFDDLPRDGQILNAIITEGGATATETPRGLALPGDIAECHAAIVALEGEMEILKARVTELQVKATKWDNWLANIALSRKRKR